MMQLDDPTKDMTNDNAADLLVSCQVNLKVYWKSFTGSPTTNKILFQRAKNFSEEANWNDYNKGTHPDMIIAGGASKEVDVSDAHLGGTTPSHPFPIDMSEVCREML